MFAQSKNQFICYVNNRQYKLLQTTLEIITVKKVLSKKTKIEYCINNRMQILDVCNLGFDIDTGPTRVLSGQCAAIGYKTA